MEDRASWEVAHASPAYRPRCPHPQVVRWSADGLGTGVGSGASVLDLGCGVGRHAIMLASRGFAVTACDFSETAIIQLRRWAAREGLTVSAHRRDIVDLSDWDDDRFDAALCFRVLNYLSAVRARDAIAEAHRLLRPGGRFFCVVTSDRDHRARSAAAPSAMLFPDRACLAELFAGFGDVRADRMTVARDDGDDDDWLVYATKAPAR